MLALGISAFYHDSAAALVHDGRVVAAAQEERFSREKHDASFPVASVRYVLEEAGATLRDVDHVAFYEKPFVKFERLLLTYLSFAPRGFASFREALPRWVEERLFQKQSIGRSLRALDPKFRSDDLLFTEHHEAHAASAFYPSPFERAAVLTMDGVGEWSTSTYGVGRGAELELRAELRFPHSLGLLYSAFTHHCGFRVNSGEYKLMGLAPYGEPRFEALILEHLIDLADDGSFRLDMRYFDYCTGLTMTSPRFDALFGGPARAPDAEIEQRHMDLAASVQRVTEEAVLRAGRHLARETGERDLCMAGGVALNCVANGRLLRDGCFERIFVQPAAGDAGGAVGAALRAYHGHASRPRVPLTPDAMAGAALGPAFAQPQVEARLREAGASFEVLDEPRLLAVVADALARGSTVGWFQGRMEYGPRALGARSILADPRSPSMQRRLNLAVKHRESFRPFAPAVLAERASEWFDLDRDSPYMLFVCDVKPERRLPVDDEPEGLARLDRPRSTIPAVTHVDGSARVQTVRAEVHPRFHALLSAFEARTGCPVLVNTSFNVRDEPIVCTPEDALRCFRGTDLDLLVVERCLVRR